MDTDYEDYAVVYSCTNSLLSGVFHSEYIWVLSRSGKISNPTRQNIYEKLDKLGINRSGLTMSDRSTCPTNSSTVARESDKDLAAQSAPVPVGGAAAPGALGEQAGQPSSAPVANLEKASVEPAQKSVVVPLLYDLPTSASSSSVGSPKPKQAAPPAPVDNKVPQLPLSGSVPNKVQQSIVAAAPVKSAVASQPTQPIVGVQQQAAPVQQQQQVQQSAGASPVSPINQKQSVQQPQQQSLMAKIQQKP